MATISALLVAFLAWTAVQNFYGYHLSIADFAAYIFMLWIPPTIVACSILNAFHRSDNVGYGISIGLISVLPGALLFLLTGIPIRLDPQGLAVGSVIAVVGESSMMLGLFILSITYVRGRRKQQTSNKR